MRHARGLHPRQARWLPCRSFNQRPTLKGPRPHKKQTHTDVRGHPCTQAHTQQVTVRVLQAEALIQQNYRITELQNYRIYRITELQNVGPSLTWTVTDGADHVRDKGWAADAVGLQVAQTYDHESGEPQEWLRFEPSTPGTHCVWAYRLYRSTQSGTAH